MSKRRGNDGRPLREVDITSEYLEVERRRYHERLRSERKSAEEKLRSAARDKGWKVNEDA